VTLIDEVDGTVEPEVLAHTAEGTDEDDPCPVISNGGKPDRNSTDAGRAATGVGCHPFRSSRTSGTDRALPFA